MARVARSWVAAGLLALMAAVSVAEAARPPADADTRPSLAGQLLVAAPELADPNFDRTVVYMIEHGPTGAMGLVINRVLGRGPLAKLLEGLGVKTEINGAAEIEVHYGGPVEQGRGFVLHSPDYRGRDTIVLSGLVAMTSSPDVLEAIAAGKGPRRSLFALGYAGWAPNQLESELAAGAWFVVEPDEALLFGHEIATKWQRALARRGIDL